MNRSKGKRAAPSWLLPLWAAKREETASHVRAAVEELLKSRDAITMASIQNKVRTLFGRMISANTIKRNEHAYEIYREHRICSRVRQTKSRSIVDLYAEAAPKQKPALQAKVARLRRYLKDDLIVRVIQLEEIVTKNTDGESRLRDEIIRLSSTQRSALAEEQPKNIEEKKQG